MAKIKDGYVQEFENHGLYNSNESSSKDVNTNIKSVLFKYSRSIQSLGGFLCIPFLCITILCIVYPAQYQNISQIQGNSTFQYTDKLLGMFENDELSDVTFSVNGKELKAHKVILAAGSSVFKVMFEHDNMVEKIHNRLEITDIDFEVLRELIRYIYTNEVSGLETIAKELLVASDKYGLEKLKIMCESVLCKNISTENLADMFIFADTYHAVLLKDAAKEYIVGHSKDVSDTVGWQLMITTHPHLIAEAFVALSNK